MKKDEIRLCEKPCLTLEEAAIFFNIGVNKLREISNRNKCEFVLWVGSKRLIKRKAFEAYLETEFSV